MAGAANRRAVEKLSRWVLTGCLAASAPALAAAYAPITPTMSDKVITLTGRDMTIEQVVDVARYGAKVRLSPEAKQRQADNYGLLLEAAAEGIPVYWFNRGAGDQRETIVFSGDPMAPKNKAYLEKSQLTEFRLGAIFGYGPEVRRGRDRARDDGHPRQCHDVQCTQPAARRRCWSTC